MPPTRHEATEQHRSTDHATGDPIDAGQHLVTDGLGGFEYEDAGSSGSGGFDVTPPQTVPMPAWVKPSGSGVITADPQGRVTIDSGANYKAFPSMAFLEGRLHLIYRDGATHAGTDSVVKYRTSDDLGRTWTSATTIVTPTSGHDTRDPYIAALSSGRLLLTYTNKNGSAYTAHARWSDNRGQTWSSAVTLPDGLGSDNETDVSAPPLELPNGTILQAGYGDFSGLYRSWVWSSTDQGETWTGPVYIAQDGTASLNETTIRYLASGKLVALIRDETSGDTYRSVSTDLGATWSAEAMVIDNNVAARPDFVEFFPSALLWFGRGTSFASRWAVSWDEGATWTALQETDSGETLDSEYHAPVVLAPGYVAVVYSIENSSTDADLYIRWYRDGFGTDPLGQADLSGLTVDDIPFDLSDPDDEEVLTYDSGSGSLVLAPQTAAVTGEQLIALGVVGPILIDDTHSTPLVFADLLQNEEGDDLLYADIGA